MAMEHLKDIEKFKAKYTEGDDLPEYLNKLVSFVERMVFNRTSKRVNFLLTRMENFSDGDTAGQMTFWNGTTWVPAETSEIIYNDTTKNIGINDSTPSEKLDVGGTIRTTRILAGGVTR